MKRTALWIIGSGVLAGVGRHVLDVDSAGVPGWELAYLVEDGPLSNRLRERGSNVIATKRRVAKAAGLVSAASAVREAVHHTEPTIVHTHLSWADFAVLFSGVGTPLVTTEHGIAADPRLYNASWLNSTATLVLHRARLRRVAAAIAVSDATQRAMRANWKCPTDRLYVVRNGMDPHLADLRHGMRLGVLSRLEREKRVELVLRSFALLHQVEPSARLIVAGTGTLERALHQLATALKIDRAVCFIGHVEPTEFWRRIDVLVQLSEWENCSYSILEALARGKGVVASDVGGNPEYVPESSLVAANATPREVAERLLLQVNISSGLPAGWPTVSEMTNQIAAVYGAVLGSHAEKEVTSERI